MVGCLTWIAQLARAFKRMSLVHRSAALTGVIHGDPGARLSSDPRSRTYQLTLSPTTR